MSEATDVLRRFYKDEANLPTSNNFHYDRYRFLPDDAGLPNETKTLQKNGRGQHLQALACPSLN
jgi:hypothetical protein